MAAYGERPLAPILDVDEKQDIKAFYHNAAFKTSRVAINLEKMKVSGSAVWGPAAGCAAIGATRDSWLFQPERHFSTGSTCLFLARRSSRAGFRIAFAPRE